MVPKRTSPSRWSFGLTKVVGCAFEGAPRVTVMVPLLRLDGFDRRRRLRGKKGAGRWGSSTAFSARRPRRREDASAPVEQSSR